MRRAGILRAAAAGLALLAAPAALGPRPAPGQTSGGQPARVLQSQPAAGAILGHGEHRFFVRFDRPVDHYRSRLLILRDGQVLRTLQPRLEAEPDVLFALVPALPPGAYEFRWSVVTAEGGTATEGGAAFTIRP